MLSIPKKVEKRFTAKINEYIKILDMARQMDVNESDTIKIIRDLLCDIFGYDKFVDVTSEYEVKGKFCDIAIKIEDVVHFIIECKAIGMTLKENHLNQALFYAERLGVDWAILTNGIVWKVYKIAFAKPITAQMLFEFDFLRDNISDDSFKEKLYVLSKESLSKSAISTYHEEKCILNKFIVSTLLQKDSVLNVVRRELRQIGKGMKVDNDQILDIIKNDILKRELIDSDDAEEAKKLIRKVEKKIQKKKQAAAKKNKSEDLHAN